MSTRRTVLIALGSGVAFTALARSSRAGRLGRDAGSPGSAPGEGAAQDQGGDARSPLAGGPPKEGADMRVHSLEVVTPDVAATCATHARLLGVRFSKPEAVLGNARTAPLQGGGTLGVRAPLRPDEAPVVRPYLLVHDIKAAVDEAAAAGCEIALPPTEVPGRGQCAIDFLGGVQHALWQV
jgi:predicted enzyme related to lactoylglutathione lyase